MSTASELIRNLLEAFLPYAIASILIVIASMVILHLYNRKHPPDDIDYDALWDKLNEIERDDDRG